MQQTTTGAGNEGVAEEQQSLGNGEGAEEVQELAWWTDSEEASFGRDEDCEMGEVAYAESDSSAEELGEVDNMDNSETANPLIPSNPLLLALNELLLTHSSTIHNLLSLLFTKSPYFPSSLQLKVPAFSREGGEQVLMELWSRDSKLQKRLDEEAS